MLTLHRNNKMIVTDENFSVKMSWINPCCSVNEMSSDAGLDITINVNKYTRYEFGNPERFEKYSTEPDRRFPGVSIRFSGFLLMSGTLVITKASSETYGCWLQSELGVMGAKQRDKNITEMPWKSNVPFNNKSDFVPGVDEYATVPVYNPIFWDGKGREEEVQVTKTLPSGVQTTDTEQITYLTRIFKETKYSLVNRMLNNGQTDYLGASCVVSPFLFLSYVIKAIFSMNGFYLDAENNALTQDDLAKTLVYNNFNILKPQFNVSEDIPKYDYDGNIINIRQITHTEWYLDTFNYADLLPKISLKDFILSVQNWINITFHVKSDQSVSIIDRNKIRDSEPYDLSAYFIGTWGKDDQKNVTLKFIQEQDKNDDVFSEWHDLSDRRNDFMEPVNTYAQLKAIVNPELGKLRLVKSEGVIYEYKWKTYSDVMKNKSEFMSDILDWVPVSTLPQPFFYGTVDEVEEIKCQCSNIRTSNKSIVNYTPYVLQHGNMTATRSLYSDFSLRMLYYEKVGVNQYKLNFDGPEGIFKRRWEKWASFWKSRLPVEGTFKLPLNELYYVINHITGKFRTREGEFIIEEMECDFKGDQMGAVHVKGYKI